MFKDTPTALQLAALARTDRHRHRPGHPRTLHCRPGPGGLGWILALTTFCSLPCLPALAGLA